MKKNLLLIATIIFANLLCLSKNTGAQKGRMHRLFNDGWKFMKADPAGAEKEGFDDTHWRKLDLPHDWSIEDLPGQSDSVIGPFSKASVSGIHTGYTVGGTAWYRKHFTTNMGIQKTTIYFDGVYMNCDVWINGKHLGNHPYGYTGFSYDLTPFLHKTNGPQQNVIAVRVRNEGRNSRWYTGSGIYRDTWITSTGPIYIQQQGVFLTASKVSAQSAQVTARTILKNELNTNQLTVVTRLKDPTGKIVASSKTNITVESSAEKEIRQTLQVNNPALWSPDQPALYQAEIEIWRKNALADRAVQTIGIRSIEFSAAKGFLLNGKKLLMKGGSVHHDNGPLGSVSIKRAEERKVELLKSYGFNAVRTSHNPPSTEFLNACDRLGLLVIDEAFDQWLLPKNPQDYHRFFNEWWQKDLSSLILRDRNHPSVIMWSIGNEIKERADSSGLSITKKLKEEIYKHDGSRPVTEAICDFWDNKGYKWDTTAAAFQLLDVGGYNYLWNQYEADHQKYPERIMVGTESFAKNAYENWQQAEKLPYVLGDFVWTAMDYMGETGIGHAELDTIPSVIKKWPWYNAYCGDIDLIGGKKPQSWFRDVVWKRRNIAMLVHNSIPEGHKEVITQWGWPDEYPSWNFGGSDGKQLQVNVYSNFSQVRLELNGKVVGEKSVSAETKLTAAFNVPYEAGVLKAFAIDNDQKVDSFVIETTGNPYKIRLNVDRKRIKANRNDLSYVTAEILDKAGRVIPDEVVRVQFSLSGDADIAATGNANPSEMASFQQPVRNTFRGRCLAIVRPTGKAGRLKVTAKSDGLLTAETEIVMAE